MEMASLYFTDSSAIRRIRVTTAWDKKFSEKQHKQKQANVAQCNMGYNR